jgi:hypothetical protein
VYTLSESVTPLLTDIKYMLKLLLHTGRAYLTDTVDNDSVTIAPI